MKKKQLFRMPVLKLTEEMCEHARKAAPIGKICYPVSGNRYSANSYFRTAVENGILRIEIYFTEHIKTGSKMPAYRLFIDRKTNDFITYDMNNQKWLTSRLDNLKWYGYFWNDKPYIQDSEKRCIETYCGIETVEKLLSYQEQIRTKQRLDSYKRRTDKWDRIMAKIPELPKDWNKWVLKEGINEHYMFYKYQRNGITMGRCSRCGKEQVLIKPKYNKIGICRNCKHSVTYKSIGKAGSIWTKSRVVHLIQPMDTGIVTRQFTVYAVYSKGKFDQPHIHCWEERRMLLDENGNAKSYYYGEYKDKANHWIQTDICTHIHSYFYDPRYHAREGVVYTRSLSQLSRTKLKQSGLPAMVRYSPICAPEIILLSEKARPLVERTAKAGLLALSMELALRYTWNLVLQPDAGKLCKCLCIDQNQLKRLRNCNGDSDYLTWLQYEKQCGKPIKDEVITWFIAEKIKPHDISFIGDLMRPEQIKNYLLKQKESMSEEKIGAILNIWRDYLSMAKTLGRNTLDAIVYRTADLKKRHNEAVLLIAEKKTGDKAQKILQRFPNLNEIFCSIKEKYEYQDEEYAVLVPKSVQDILMEGNVLVHCIDKTDTYFERISNMETYILFLRKVSDPSVPYYTLEVEPDGTIRQKRTMFNRQNADIADATAFLKKWQLMIQKRLSKEDQRLAKTSKRLRKQQYQKLRDDEVKIRQGNYEGRLLVDLLEEDLMEIMEAA